jgi:hypothetical protein
VGAETLLVPVAAALLGSGVGAWTARGVSRTSRAHSLYNAYLERCLEHPELASYNAFMSGRQKRGKPSFDPYKFEGVDVEKYQWFISLMLVAMEEIVAIKPFDNEWKDVARDQANYHGGYFQASWPSIRKSYSCRLRRIFDPMFLGKPHAHS